MDDPKPASPLAGFLLPIPRKAVYRLWSSVRPNRCNLIRDMQLGFSIYENKEVFALLLGSGLSRSAEIPTGWEITLDLVRRVALAQGVDAQQDWGQWYRDATGSEPSYSLLLEELASSPQERRAILHSYIEPTESDREVARKIPTKAHHAIASLVRSGYIRVVLDLTRSSRSEPCSRPP